MLRMPSGPAPALLTAFAVGTLGMLEAVAWLGRTPSPWVLLAVVVFALVLVVRLGVELARLLDDKALPRTGVLTASVVALVLVGGAVPFAAGALARAGLGAPQATVRGYMLARIDADGETACRYLSRIARAHLERQTGQTGQTCESYFPFTVVHVGAHPLTSSSELAAAAYTVAPRGRDRVVTMRYDGQHSLFLLAPASAAERQEYMAPQTPWRIASDVASRV
jgi:hypothetical protein